MVNDCSVFNTITKSSRLCKGQGDHTKLDEGFIRHPSTCNPSPSTAFHSARKRRQESVCAWLRSADLHIISTSIAAKVNKHYKKEHQFTACFMPLYFDCSR